MTPYSPTSPRHRAALALVASVCSLSLMSSVLFLFSDGRLPWAGPEANAAGRDPSCAATLALGGQCSTRVAKGPAAAASSATVVQPVQQVGATIRVANQ
jgi:hypothetical protein